MSVKKEIIKILRDALIILAIELGIYLLSEGLVMIVWGSESNDVWHAESYEFDMQDAFAGDSSISTLDDLDPSPTPSPTLTPTPSPTPTPTPTPDLERQAFFEDVSNDLDDMADNQQKIMISIWALCGVLVGFKILRGVFG